MADSFCKSLYPFSGEQHAHGLSFEAGDVIRVVQALPGGWWEGERDGARGWFPSSYVQVLEPPEEELKEPLPQHWKCYMSPQGHKYYVNTTNNETTWERPSSVPGTPKMPQSHKNSLPHVNGFHGSGSPLHPDHSSLRRSSTEPQSPASTSPTRKQHKETTVTVNCVTFPVLSCLSEQPLLKPHEWSYCDYFWADRKEAQANSALTGFEVLLQKQMKGKHMQKEMAEFIRERYRKPRTINRT